MPEVIPQTIKAEHILGAAIMFVHPTTGNRYYGVCEKQGGTDQNFVVYRRKPGQATFEFVAQLDGAGLDADAFITMGGAVITMDGSLEIWASGQPKGQPDASGTGFDAIGKVVPGVDEPWAFPKAVKAAPTPAHIRLNPPAGYRPYGANQSFALSAETVNGQPVYYFAQEGWGYSTQNGGFGEYVFRQVGNGQAEYVRYNGADVPDGRGDLYIAGNGKLYITGNESDDDKLPSVYEVPGFVPFGSVAYISGAQAVGSADTSLLEGRIAALEGQFAALTKRVSATEGVANKANERGQNALTQLGALPKVLSRDEVWQLAGDRVFADTNAALEAIRADIKLRPTGGDVVGIAQQVINGWLNASIAYADKRLLNLLWDRAVKLLRYKESTGKTAAQLPINDQSNIEH